CHVSFSYMGKKTPEHKSKTAAISRVHSSDPHSLARSCQRRPLRPCRNLSTSPPTPPSKPNLVPVNHFSSLYPITVVLWLW
ncbi:hypothetical protein A2U01_0088185, partial [Trifolium medium]|nr:hypothetical protein [Trifolium medium]